MGWRKRAFLSTDLFGTREKVQWSDEIREVVRCDTQQTCKYCPFAYCVWIDDTPSFAQARCCISGSNDITC